MSNGKENELSWQRIKPGYPVPGVQTAVGKGKGSLPQPNPNFRPKVPFSNDHQKRCTSLLQFLVNLVEAKIQIKWILEQVEN